MNGFEKTFQSKIINFPRLDYSHLIDSQDKLLGDLYKNEFLSVDEKNKTIIFKIGNWDILKPLIQETANKILLLDPAKAQTGPARRNDQVTINAHLKLLMNDDYKKLYKTFTQLIKDENKL